MALIPRAAQSPASINKGISTNMDKKFIFMIYYLKIYYLLFRESAVG
ncbi:hypothetical protein BN891_47870 [Bacteroides xylanisolvens SD CC 2a]|nr:hypothetical protein BN891_47870 [Bacteroides xylanisolvens SD CC 2a]